MSEGDSEFWWNTSAELLEQLDRSRWQAPQNATWERFASIYDKPDCRKKRKMAWETARRTWRPIQSDIMRAGNYLKELHSWEGVVSEATANHQADLFKFYFYGLCDHEKSWKSGLKHPVIYDAIRAFCHYIVYYRQLPTKEALNVEANRRRNCLMLSWQSNHRSPRIGDLYEYEQKSYKIFTPRIYTSEIGDFISACPEEQWHLTRWSRNAFSTEILTPAGLGGLARKRR
ncbi:MAG TPA: hypothetical protein VG796_01225 [Verrucomicrobiales bacterium]|nr:hypothetical protein [Verrucomicrobiales bacterium]